MELKNFFAQDDAGNYLSEATCYVYMRGTESLVTGLRKANGIALANPFASDQNGLVEFVAPNGLYDVRVVKGDRDFRVRIQFNDVAETVQAAEAAADRAEVARDAAQLSSGVVTSIEAGLVATQSGGYFSVTSPQSNDYLILYKNESGVAVETKRYPSADYVKSAKDAIDLLIAPDAGEPLFAFDDMHGETVMQLDAASGLRLVGIEGTVQEVVNGVVVTAGEVARLVGEDTVGSLYRFDDKFGEVVLDIDLSGGMHLTGLEGSVQDVIKGVGESVAGFDARLGLADREQTMYAWDDIQGEEVMSLDVGGGLRLAGVEGTVQEALNRAGRVTIDRHNIEKMTAAALFSREVLDFAVMRSMSGRGGVQPPRSLVPQQYTTGLTWIDRIDLVRQTEHIPILGYEYPSKNLKEVGVVHPHFIHFDTPMAGYRYWLGLTPYTNTNENFEVPYIYGTNDDNLRGWTLIPGFPQPFDVDPPQNAETPTGHLSDDTFTYNPITGELFFVWRKSLRGPNSTPIYDSIWCRSTTDGVNWSEIKRVSKDETRTGNSMLSPAILFDARTRLYNMFNVHDGKLQRQVSSTLSVDWTDPVVIPLPAGISPWHLDCKFVGNMAVLLLHDNVKDQLTLGISSDMINWSFSTQSLFTSEGSLYRSSFDAILNESGEIALRVFYTSDEHSNPKWQLFQVTSNFTSRED